MEYLNNIFLLNYFEKKYKKNDDLKVTKNKKLKKAKIYQF